MALARQHPARRAEIAYLGVYVAANLSDTQRTIYTDLIGDGFASLELPDAHVDKRLGTVDEQWDELESYIDKLG